MTLKGYACWEQADALRLLATEALEGENALFLATHNPINNFSVRGSRAALVERCDERGLMAVLSREDNRHAFCVVEGEPGSGKSHLIRWLNVNWPRPTHRDLVLLVQRADGSLEGTLANLRDRVPEKYRPIFDGLGRTSKVTEDGRRRDFQTKLANSMERGYFDTPPEDAEWCAQHHVAQILAHEKARELWGAPRRILQILGGRSSTGSTRDQELAEFTLYDVAQIGQMHRELRGVPVAALRWLRALSNEASELQKLSVMPTPSTLSQDDGTFPESLAFLHALNRRLNNAIQELLGTTARQLDELFKTFRRHLRADQRRLVLLLEDVTNWQGVDEKLIDALVFNADTAETDAFCDLVSVLGVTPDYFRRFIETKSNYAQRITEHVLLNAGVEAGADDFVLPFASRYLRAVRAGVKRLHEHEEGNAVFNRCGPCPKRPECHQAFGEFEGVGLYPFTKRSLAQMFAGLNDPSNLMTVQTPRGLIQNILGPTLHRPDALEQGDYPHPGLETTYLRRKHLDGWLRASVERQDEAQREPLRRLLSWWGEPSERMPVGKDERGNPLYQGVPKAVFETFGLPWMGQDIGSVTAKLDAPTTPGASDDTGDTFTPAGPPGTGSAEKGRSAPPKGGAAGGTRGAKQAAKVTLLTAAQLELRLDQLNRWWETGDLEDGESFWNKWLHRFMSIEVPWRRMGISPWLQATLFTEASVMIAGTKRTHGAHFVVDKSEWLRDGLESMVQLNSRDFQASDFDRYRLARLARKLETHISDYVRLSLGLADGTRWSPIGVVAQVALARAWLRGTLHPSMPLVEQWAYLFNVEPTAEASPKKRVESWLNASGRTSPFPGELAKRLPYMVNQTQVGAVPGLHGQSELGMADPAAAIPAMRDLIDRLMFGPSPSAKDGTFDNFLKMTIGIATDIDLPQVAVREGRRLIEVAKELDGATPGQSVLEFVRRVQEAITGISGVDAGAPNESIQQWTQAHADAKKLGFLAVTARVDAVDQFKVEAQSLSVEDFRSAADLMNWCIKVPVDDVIAARDLVRRAEISLESLVAHADDLLRAAGSAGGTTLDQLHDRGKALNDSCDALLKEFSKGD